MRIEKQALQRRLPGCVLLLLALCLTALAFPCAAQPPPQKENRFLFVINTSSGMRRDTNAVKQAVLGLLQSGMEGQMRDGDTFGIWTYDDQPHFDFPMQIWSKQRQDEITGAVTSFLAGRRYQNRAHLEKVLPVLRQTIAASRVLTVIFIYDGSETMQGSGFDKEINDLQKQFGRAMRNHNLPFVTLLAVWNGKAIDFSVNTPAKISMLQTADLIKPPVTNTPPPVVVAVVPLPPPPPVVVPPPAPPPRHFEIILTNPPEAAPPAVAVAEPVAAPAATAKPEPATLPAGVPAQPLPATSASSAEIAPPAVTEPAKPQLPAPAAIPPAAQLPSPPPAAAAQAQVTPPPATAVPPVLAATVAPVVSTPPVQPASIATPPAQAAQPAAAPAPPLAQTAVVTPEPADHVALLVIAFSLLTIAVVLVLIFLRRSRPAASLISQSLDNPH